MPAGTTKTVIIPASDANGDTLSWSVSGPAWATIDAATGVVTVAPPASVTGTFTVTVTANDGWGGIASTSFTVTVTPGNVPPVIQPIAPITVNEGAVATATVTATDPLGGAVSLALSGAPGWITLNGNQITLAPGFGVVVHPATTLTGTFTVTATNSKGLSSNKTVSYTVNDVNRPPAFPTLGPYTVVEGKSQTVSLGATDPDGDAITYSIVSAPTWVTLGAGGQVTLAPPVGTAAGQYTVTVQAKDPYNASATATFMVIVKPSQSAAGVAAAVARGFLSPFEITRDVKYVVDANQKVPASFKYCKQTGNSVCKVGATQKNICLHEINGTCDKWKTVCSNMDIEYECAKSPAQDVSAELQATTNERNALTPNNPQYRVTTPYGQKLTQTTNTSTTNSTCHYKGNPWDNKGPGRMRTYGLKRVKIGMKSVARTFTLILTNDQPLIFNAKVAQNATGASVANFNIKKSAQYCSVGSSLATASIYGITVPYQYHSWYGNASFTALCSPIGVLTKLKVSGSNAGGNCDSFKGYYGLGHFFSYLDPTFTSWTNIGSLYYIGWASYFFCFAAPPIAMKHLGCTGYACSAKFRVDMGTKHWVCSDGKPGVSYRINKYCCGTLSGKRGRETCNPRGAKLQRIGRRYQLVGGATAYQVTDYGYATLSYIENHMTATRADIDNAVTAAIGAITNQHPTYHSCTSTITGSTLSAASLDGFNKNLHTPPLKGTITCMEDVPLYTDQVHLVNDTNPNPKSTCRIDPNTPKVAPPTGTVELTDPNNPLVYGCDPNSGYASACVSFYDGTCHDTTPRVYCKQETIKYLCSSTDLKLMNQGVCPAQCEADLVTYLKQLSVGGLSFPFTTSNGCTVTGSTCAATYYGTCIDLTVNVQVKAQTTTKLMTNTPTQLPTVEMDPYNRDTDPNLQPLLSQTGTKPGPTPNKTTLKLPVGDAHATQYPIHQSTPTLQDNPADPNALVDKMKPGEVGTAEFAQLVQLFAVAPAALNDLEARGGTTDTNKVSPTQFLLENVFSADYYNCTKDLIFDYCKMKNPNVKPQTCMQFGWYCTAKALGVCYTWHQDNCCYQTKFNKSLGVQIHNQLGISWGPQGARNCKGITVDDLRRVDWTKIDFSALKDQVANSMGLNLGAAKNAIKGNMSKLTQQFGQKLMNGQQFQFNGGTTAQMFPDVGTSTTGKDGTGQTLNQFMQDPTIQRQVTPNPLQPATSNPQLNQLPWAQFQQP